MSWMPSWLRSAVIIATLKRKRVALLANRIVIYGSFLRVEVIRRGSIPRCCLPLWVSFVDTQCFCQRRLAGRCNAREDGSADVEGDNLLSNIKGK